MKSSAATVPVAAAEAGAGNGGGSGLFVSLINRLSTSSTPPNQKWTPHFSRLVDRLASTPKPEQQIHQLAGLEETYLRHPRFENTSYFAQVDLFHLWECALGCALAPKLATGKRMVALRVVLLVMERGDFDMGEDVCQDSKRKYNKLLVASFELATLILRSPSTVDETLFCAEALAVFLFRLPYCSTLLVNALGQKELDEAKRRGSRQPPSVSGAAPTPTPAFRRRSRDKPHHFSAFVLPKPERDDEDGEFIRANPNLFQWNSTFTDPSVTSAVVELIQDSTKVWSLFLQNKEAFFLRFVEKLVQHVTRVVVVRGEIRWSCVPAYEMILTCFVELLRSAIWWDSVTRRTPGQGMGWVTSMAGYLKVKKTALAVLQSNPSLLRFYVQTTFECTNLHSLLSVDSCIEHLHLFITATAVPSPLLHTTSRVRKCSATALSRHFHHDSFWGSFRLILQSESYQVLLKSCSFLYNVLDLFLAGQRTKLVSDLLQPELFWGLFLHWSGEVRTCFHHLVVYKILRCDRRFLPCFSDSQVMLLYGVARGGKRAITVGRIETSARAAWGTLLLTSSPPNAECATKDEVAQLTKSAQRRMAIFDTQVDDEELWFDMSVSSKIDSYVRMCLQAKEGDEAGGGVPKRLAVYVQPALEQYSLLLIRYYRGATLASLDDIPASLSHRMVLTEFSESSM